MTRGKIQHQVTSSLQRRRPGFCLVQEHPMNFGVTCGNQPAPENIRQPFEKTASQTGFFAEQRRQAPRVLLPRPRFGGETPHFGSPQREPGRRPPQPRPACKGGSCRAPYRAGEPALRCSRQPPCRGLCPHRGRTAPCPARLGPARPGSALPAALGPAASGCARLSPSSSSFSSSAFWRPLPPAGMEAIEELALKPCTSSLYLRPFRLCYRQVSGAGGSPLGARPAPSLTAGPSRPVPPPLPSAAAGPSPA